MLTTLMTALAAILAYLLGSVNGSIIVSRLLYGSDVRSRGSGNAGLTNYYRSYGIPGLVTVVGIDVLKGVAGALLGGLFLSFAAPDPLREEFIDTGRLVATFCVILGHCYPVFHGFRGGKGILTGVSCVLVVNPQAAAIALFIFAIIVVATRYVSLGSIIATLSVPVTLLANGFSGRCMLLALISVALIVLRHAENIRRLLNHREARISFKKDVSHKIDNDSF